MFTANSDEVRPLPRKKSKMARAPPEARAPAALCHDSLALRRRHRVEEVAAEDQVEVLGGDGLRRISLDGGDAGPREVFCHEVDHLGEVEHRHLPALLLEGQGLGGRPAADVEHGLGGRKQRRQALGQRPRPLARPTRIEPMKARSDSGVRSRRAGPPLRSTSGSCTQRTSRS